MAAAILSRIHAAAAFTWAIERIVLVEPWRGRWTTLDDRNDGSSVPAWIIHQPHYVVAARMIGAPGVEVAKVEQQGAAFVRRMLGEALTPAPYLGRPDWVATCHLVQPGATVDAHPSLLASERDLGWLPYDIGPPARPAPRHFRATLKDGVLDVPRVPPGQLAS